MDIFVRKFEQDFVINIVKDDLEGLKIIEYENKIQNNKNLFKESGFLLAKKDKVHWY